jgi:hypothetical protein
MMAQLIQTHTAHCGEGRARGPCGQCQIDVHASTHARTQLSRRHARPARSLCGRKLRYRGPCSGGIRAALARLTLTVAVTVTVTGRRLRYGQGVPYCASGSRRAAGATPPLPVYQPFVRPSDQLGLLRLGQDDSIEGMVLTDGTQCANDILSDRDKRSMLLI